MKSRIIRSRIRHQVSFAPNPENLAFPTNPVFVESRKVEDLKEIPEWTKHIMFNDVVETEVFFTSGAQTLFSPPFNRNTYVVTHSRNEAAALTTNNWVPVSAASHLADKVWVFETLYQHRDRAA